MEKKTLKERNEWLIERLMDYHSYDWWKKDDKVHRYEFMWDAVHCNINTRHCYKVMPRFLHHMTEMSLCYDESLFGVSYDDVCGIPQDEILFLVKPNKAFHQKPEDIKDMCNFIAAVLKDTRVKYLYYGVRVLDESNHKEGMAKYGESWVRSAWKTGKIYQKEIDAIMDCGYRLVESGLTTNRYKEFRGDTFTVSLKDGYLFEIPQLEEWEVQRLLNEIVDKRVKEICYRK